MNISINIQEIRMHPCGEISRHKGLKNYCYFFFYTHVLITIGNTRVFLKTQPMHLCDGLVYNRILAIVDTYMCIEQQRKCSQYVQHFRVKD